MTLPDGLPEAGQSTTRTPEATLDPPACPEADRARLLAEEGRLGDATGQSVIVTILQVLARIRRSEQTVAASAMSLAQREKLTGMIAGLDAFSATLEKALQDPGRKMLALKPRARAEPAGESLWWFALAEALQAIEAGVKQIAAVVAGRPRGHPARLLGSLAMRLLRRHEHALLAEAAHWMSS
ncbi:hypothetical protein GQ464_011085 [Rhodocaloribacter litoris]|uniref:hypothetical protein n=1 Tax=Rhodocaloribacter litoris TaxID=2558931 RepID=UPI001424A371|nr:hypothetical protein [Rhodocaloribacter litoris]QXD14001.1 hypothetical protein GQ464_011085 [Rhodocaloribacter litoris]